MLSKQQIKRYRAAEPITELGKIFKKHRTDKFSFHRYDRVYEWLLSDFRFRTDIRLLEIGVQGGGSLRAWEEYLPYAEIVGLDKNPRAADLRFSRAQVLTGNSANSELLRSLGQFDIIIDDGDHGPISQMQVFCDLWPSARQLYVIEDLNFSRDNTTTKQIAELAVLNTKSRGADHAAEYWIIFANELLAFKRVPQ